jgi:hypothetical protein
MNYFNCNGSGTFWHSPRVPPLDGPLGRGLSMMASGN